MSIDTLTYAIGPSSLGLLLVAQSPRGLCSIMIGDEAEALRNDLQRRFPKAALIEGADALGSLVSTLSGLIDTPSAAYDGPLDLRGTAFQESVWKTLMTVPAGQTLTYSELAQKVGRPKAVRAVATACGANHVAVVVPCHRIIGRNGSLTGYRWGVERKAALLAREQVA